MKNYYKPINSMNHCNTTSDIKLDTTLDTMSNNMFNNTISSENNLINNYCNNCGKNGHIYHQCKQPITNIGIITFRKNKMNNKIEYLLIRRNHSLGFSDFISGKYPLYNKNYLINIINEMSNEEKKMILEKDFDDLWKWFWGENENVKYRNDEKISRSKYISLKIGITINNQEYDLKRLIDESVTNWEETEWGFPKGRRNFQEKDLQCAIREFEEETGYNINELCIIKNLIPYEELFTGSNYKSYKHKYYVGYMNNDNTNEMINHVNNYEVGKVAWFNYQDACNIIRPYNLEKLSILEKVNKILTQYRFI